MRPLPVVGISPKVMSLLVQNMSLLTFVQFSSISDHYVMVFICHLIVYCRSVNIGEIVSVLPHKNLCSY